jgi:tetratricopeptide (TPR) repeat protein
MKARCCIWLSISIVLYGPASTAQTGRTHVTVVGIKAYADNDLRRPWLKYADQDAELFADYVKSRPARDVAAAMLTDRQTGLPATRTNILTSLERMLIRETGEQEDAYIFISGRGRATSGFYEGYLDAIDTQSEKGPASAVLISDLARIIRQSRARHIFIFADVCRESKVDNKDNIINLRLEELRIPGKPVDLILASEPRKSSFEDETLKYGVFSYALVDGLKGSRYPGGTVTENSTILEFFNYLKDRLGSLTKSEKPVQQPYPAPRRPDVRLFSPQPIGSPPLPRHLGLFASIDRPSLIDTGPSVDSQEQPSTELRQYVNQLLAAGDDQRDSVFGRITGSLSADQKFDLAAALENEGQLVVARYGVGDQFPGDPLQLKDSDFRRASRAFWAAAELKPADPTLQSRGRFCLGRLLLFDRKNQASLNQAAALLQDSIRIDQDTSRRYRDSRQHQAPEAYHALGIYYLETGQYDHAATAFNDAIERAPNWPYPRHNLALALTEQGRYADAERAYRAAIEHTPYYPYLHYNLALLLHRTNRVSAALEEYGRALQWFERRAETFTEYGRRLRLDNKGGEADLADERAHQAMKNQAQVWNGLGVLHEAMKLPAEAVSDYERAMKSDETLLAAAHNLALLYLASRPDESIRIWDELLKKDPGRLSARLALANALASHGDRVRARREFDEILRVQPDNFEARKGVAGQLAAGGAFNAAVDELQKAMVQQAAAGIVASSSDHELLGDWNGQIDRNVEACRQYELALKALRSESDGVRPRRAVLKRKLLSCKSRQSH